jgi:uncharacterized membrane protein (UPF0127 family)
MRRSDATLALALMLALAAPMAVLGQECSADQADLRDADTTLRFQVEVVDDAGERAQGLMNRETLPKFSGMLFVYETPQPVAFWMKNTLIPLDMLFFDPQGRLTRIQSQARPLDETPIVGGDNVQYVLEINGGLAESLGIDLGAELRHPALSDPSWSCED